jgi:phosphoribosylanthranilate isomerase
MTISVKICGIDRIESVDAAVENGATYLGFVFYQPSPRNLSLEKAKQLIYRVPKNVIRVGLFVNPTDAEIEDVLSSADLDMIQLHGHERPPRILEIKKISQLPILKAIKLDKQKDLKSAKDFYDVADHLLFDSKAPATLKNALPGGNAISFDWQLLRHAKIPLPWMLAGGLNISNIAKATISSGATTLDVSSGVERVPGVKDLNLISKFLNAVKEIENPKPLINIE